MAELAEVYGGVLELVKDAGLRPEEVMTWPWARDFRCAADPGCVAEAAAGGGPGTWETVKALPKRAPRRRGVAVPFMAYVAVCRGVMSVTFGWEFGTGPRDFEAAFRFGVDVETLAGPGMAAALVRAAGLVPSRKG
jgi:hypothetical protein